MHSLVGQDEAGAAKESGHHNRFEGLKREQLIDAIYDRKVQLLNEQVSRLLGEMKKKEGRLAEYKTKDTNRRREIQLLECELAQRKATQRSKKSAESQNISMYRDQVRKLTQRNEQLKKSLQAANDNLKSAELKKEDIQEEFKSQRQTHNHAQQKMQRVLHQSTLIQDQLETLHNMLVKKRRHGHGHGHHQRGSSHSHSMDAADKVLDTIRKSNVRGIQILNEMMQKGRKYQSQPQPQPQPQPQASKRKSAQSKFFLSY